MSLKKGDPIRICGPTKYAGEVCKIIKLPKGEEPRYGVELTGLTKKKTYHFRESYLQKEIQVEIKKDDRVRIINKGPCHGRIATVVEVPKYGETYTVIVDGGVGERLYFSRTEIDPLDPVDLQQLLDDANKGFIALGKLKKDHKHLIETYFVPLNLISDLVASKTDWTTYVNNLACGYLTGEQKLRKKRWEPFNIVIGSGKHESRITVTLDGDVIRLGCEEFPAQEISAMLKALCTDGASSFEFNSGGGFYSLRTGVVHKDWTVTWADADRILNALQKAGY